MSDDAWPDDTIRIPERPAQCRREIIERIAERDTTPQPVKATLIVMAVDLAVDEPIDHDRESRNDCTLSTLRQSIAIEKRASMAQIRRSRRASRCPLRSACLREAAARRELAHIGGQPVKGVECSMSVISLIDTSHFISRAARVRHVSGGPGTLRTCP